MPKLINLTRANEIGGSAAPNLDTGSIAGCLVKKRLKADPVAQDVVPCRLFPLDEHAGAGHDHVPCGWRPAR